MGRGSKTGGSEEGGLRRGRGLKDSDGRASERKGGLRRGGPWRDGGQKWERIQRA